MVVDLIRLTEEDWWAAELKGGGGEEEGEEEDEEEEAASVMSLTAGREFRWGHGDAWEYTGVFTDQPQRCDQSQIHYF